MTQVESKLNGLFDHGMQSFGEALKAGVKVQEDMAKWWTDVLEKGGPVQDWQKRSSGMLSEAFPVYQRNAEEWLKVFEQNYRKTMSLLKKAISAGEDGEPTPDFQARTQQLWEASLETVRDNTQAMAQANVKMMEAWAELLRKATDTAARAAQSGAAAAK